MTTENLVENFIELAIKSYKKNGKGSQKARKLERHETIIVDGNEISCWREFACYKMAEWIAEEIPEAKVILDLDGNDSVIRIEVSEEEQRELNSKMISFLKKIERIKK